MSDLDILIKYFPALKEDQLDKFRALGPLYRNWNEKINVISRKDIDHLYLKHVLHSLAIARFTSFGTGCNVLDAGTGGGFPGIPLAIMYPEVNFILVDSVRKKIRVVKEVAGRINARNITTINDRVEKLNRKFQFAVGRAVTSMPLFYEWVSPLISREDKRHLPNGIIALKGGKLKEELGSLYNKSQIIQISGYFEEDFFSSKQLVYIPVK